jgi:hypothetical protein
VAIGLAVQFDIKGSKESMLRLMAEGLLREGPGLFFLAWLAVWGLVAAAVGWVLHSLIVIAIDSKHEDQKPMA